MTDGYWGQAHPNGKVTAWSSRRQEKKARGLSGRQWVKARKAAQREARKRDTRPL